MCKEFPLWRVAQRLTIVLLGCLRGPMGKEDEKEQPKTKEKHPEPTAGVARTLAADECGGRVERLVTQLARNK